MYFGANFDTFCMIISKLYNRFSKNKKEVRDFNKMNISKSNITTLVQ